MPQQHKMHSIHVITSQQYALHICQNITRCTEHIPQHHNIRTAFFYVFSTMHYDIIMQHKPMKCTLLKLIF